MKKRERVHKIKQKSVKKKAMIDMFLMREMWPDYNLMQSIIPAMKPIKNGEWIEYGLWPLIVRVYQGDERPNIENKYYLTPRILAWDRTKCDNLVDTKGWLSIGKEPRKLYGYLEIRDNNYTQKWNETARYGFRKWQSVYRKQYDIVEVSFKEFSTLYKQSETYTMMEKSTRDNPIKSSEKRDTSGRLCMVYLLLREKETGILRAGLAYESSYESTNTYYSIGFLKSYQEKNPLMIGLIHEWIERERVKGIHYFNFGAFWKKGDPKSWKGYSIFKKKFGVTMVALPPSLIRIKWFW